MQYITFHETNSSITLLMWSWYTALELTVTIRTANTELGTSLVPICWTKCGL